MRRLRTCQSAGNCPKAVSSRLSPAMPRDWVPVMTRSSRWIASVVRRSSSSRARMRACTSARLSRTWPTVCVRGARLFIRSPSTASCSWSRCKARRISCDSASVPLPASDRRTKATAIATRQADCMSSSTNRATSVPMLLPLLGPTTAVTLAASHTTASISADSECASKFDGLSHGVYTCPYCTHGG